MSMFSNVEDIVVYRDLKVFITDNSIMLFCSRNAQVPFVAKLRDENEQFSKLKTFISNEALSFLQRWSLEISFTVPFT